jgi:deoxyribodipyrimidine photo-lyase
MRPKKTHRKSLFVFRRDLRLEDNTGLTEALRSSACVVPCFIFDPRQVEENPYRSDNAVQFMVESLQGLERQLKRRSARLYLFYGKAEAVIAQLIAAEELDAVYVNRDYTPFSRRRDEAIGQVCRRRGARFEQCSDLLLAEPEQVLTTGGTPYTIFTAFHRRAFARGVEEPRRNRHRNFWRRPITLAQSGDVYERVSPGVNRRLAVRGGRAAALRILGRMEGFRRYGMDRDYPARKATTRLSAHLKFGTCSIREAHQAVRDALGADHPLARQLYWRDFYTYVAHHFPYVLGRSFRKEYDAVPWRRDRRAFRAWCEGRTGFPIVDAGMRELNTTGFMHNRSRMIVASFLTKDLHIDWRWGEKYFAQKLVDYDPSVNNGNWQWVASTGCDAQPYFRVFNPWVQQKRYDPECEHIKEWIPELLGLSPSAIHRWEREAGPEGAGYPRPIVEHRQESAIAKRMYAAVKRAGAAKR